MMHLITYVTHSAGMYEELKEDAVKYGITLTVLGWGEKWVSYFQKLKSVLHHLGTLDRNDAAAVIDGFDTRISGTLAEFETRWRKEYGGRVVFSKENRHGRVPEVIEDYVNARIFGGVVNAGMYAGNVSDLLNVLDRALDFEQVCRGDDQCAFNKICRLITVDEKQLLFHNKVCASSNANNAVFVSHPGMWTWERQIRFLKSSCPFFAQEALLILVVLLISYIVTSNISKKVKSDA